MTLTPADTEEPLFSVRDLRVGFDTATGTADVVSRLSFDLAPGRCLAIVGESGSGKSVTARTLVGLTGRNARVDAARLRFDGRDVGRFSEKEWRGIRGRDIGFVLQDALVSLDPLRPVGKEIGEALALHGWSDRRGRARKVVDLLDSVGVPEPAVRARQLPHELSGGLRQRALIAAAIALHPRVVIADEPTTALDVTVQAQVLDLFEEMKNRGTAIVLISHDLAVVSRLADDILVMTGGRVVEQEAAAQVLRRPAHPYTRSLLDAIPGEHTRGTSLTNRDLGETTAVEASGNCAAVLEAEGLVKSFLGPDRARRTVVNHVSFVLLAGETLGIVGESGSGKSTTARLALALDRPDAGRVLLHGAKWSELSPGERRPLRRAISVVSQDPLSSFDPRWTVERIIADSVDRVAFPTRARRRERVLDLIDQVGLSSALLARNPLTLSGGQRQRVAIARALAPNPSVIVLDEAVSALDVSVQAQVLDVLSELQNRLGVSYLFISHDLGVVRHMSDKVLVMKDGHAVEQGSAEAVFSAPAHPYTRQLLESLPRVNSTAVPSG